MLQLVTRRSSRSMDKTCLKKFQLMLKFLKCVLFMCIRATRWPKLSFFTLCWGFVNYVSRHTHTCTSISTHGTDPEICYSVEGTAKFDAEIEEFMKHTILLGKIHDSLFHPSPDSSLPISQSLGNQNHTNLI